MTGTARKKLKKESPEALADTTYDGYRATYLSAAATVKSVQAAKEQVVASRQESLATQEQAKATMQQAKASEKMAQVAIDRAQQNLDYCTIKSPVKGVIIDRRVNVGQTAVSSMNPTSMFLIAKDLTRMQVWVSVNEADIANIHPGQPVTFTVDAYPSTTFRGEAGKVRFNATMTQNVVTYTVEVLFDNSSGKLFPYMTANVQFHSTSGPTC